jgi:hypothetical protein
VGWKKAMMRDAVGTCRRIRPLLKEIDMKMRSLIGLFVAAALTAGAGAVHAIKLVDMAATHPGHKTAADRTYTYALETLLKSSGNTTDSSDVGDSTTYYNILADHYVAGPADISGRSGDTYLVSYVLNNMVFSDALDDDSITVTARRVDGDGNPENDADGNPQLALSPKADALVIIAGGAVGDSTVVYRLETADTTPTITGSDVITLTAQFAITGSGSGSITRTVVNRALEGSGVSSSKTHVLPSAVRALPALKETIKPNEGPAISSVDFDFMTFYRSTAATRKLAEWVGYVELTVVAAPAAYRHAHAGGTDSEGGTLPDTVTALGEITSADTTTTPSGSTKINNSVVFSGEVSFLKKIGLMDAAAGATVSTCATIGDDLRVASTDDPAVLTDEFRTLKSGDFATRMFLCIQVDGETVIPPTDAYTVTTKYTGVTGAAFPPQGSTYELGGIVQDGTSYTIPYLTSFEDYNQRLSLVNFGPKPVRFNFHSFSHEDGVTVAEGMDATGVLPVGQTVLRTSDIVDIMGGNRASARLSIVSAPRHMSAAVQQINLETRGVDTVYLVHGQ